jgi:hypothetical protein
VWFTCGTWQGPTVVLQLKLGLRPGCSHAHIWIHTRSTGRTPESAWHAAWESVLRGEVRTSRRSRSGGLGVVEWAVALPCHHGRRSPPFNRNRIIKPTTQPHNKNKHLTHTHSWSTPQRCWMPLASPPTRAPPRTVRPRRRPACGSGPLTRYETIKVKWAGRISLGQCMH